jgi:hypothetical protein
LRRLIGILAVTAVLTLSGIVFAGIALAQTATTAPTATTARAATATTATTVRAATTATTARTTATTARAAAPAAQARTGARTDFEVTLAGAAFVLGGSLLFFAQPLRRARKQS